MRGAEDVRDRRTRLRGIDNFDSFMKFLAPIERGPVERARCAPGEAAVPRDRLRLVPRARA